MQVSEKFLHIIFSAIEMNPTTELHVDLEKQKITLLESGSSEHFEIDAYKKVCMINGYDDIDYLLSMKDKIQDFEKNLVVS